MVTKYYLLTIFFVSFYLFLLFIPSSNFRILLLQQSQCKINVKQCFRIFVKFNLFIFVPCLLSSCWLICLVYSHLSIPLSLYVFNYLFLSHRLFLYFPFYLFIYLFIYLLRLSFSLYIGLSVFFHFISIFSSRSFHPTFYNFLLEF